MYLPEKLFMVIEERGERSNFLGSITARDYSYRVALPPCFLVNYYTCDSFGHGFDEDALFHIEMDNSSRFENFE